MVSITIANLEESVESELRSRAARNGRSLEDEARAILEAAVSQPEPRMSDLIRKYIEPVGGVELDIPVREPLREPPKFD